ncbi:peptidase T [bacterium]|nr:peptidase T [bacterium]MBU1071638.1 peptidase T [bacterium]MBU1675076.1 peptidase T [bacterium]
MLSRKADTIFPTLTERFVKYARINTQAQEGSETYPSSACQLNLARVLVQELQDLGLTDAAMDKHGYVTATLPANEPSLERVPVIAFISHMDTYPEVSGKNVNPLFHENYQGGDIRLPENDVVIPASENPYLEQCLGETIITSDGTTLLGADDKAGIAEIMEALTRMVENPDFEHGTVKVAFTPDEEIGKGVLHFDVEKFGATVAYTMDGGQRGDIENETYCADTAVVTFTGRDIHPGYAKDKMVPAVKVAAEFVTLLPRDMAPETTEGKQGYLHPINIEGNTSKVTVNILVRDFDVKELEPKVDRIRKLAAKACAAWPGSSFAMEIKEYYRNMKYDLEKEPRAVDYATEAIRRVGLKPKLSAIRGGTDGSNLSARGLPTPNLFTGEQSFHSYTEWICAKDMELATRTILQTITVWAEKESA